MHKAMFLSLVLLTFLLPGCGREAGPPTDGDALREHLLGILQASHEATLAGDLPRAHAPRHPEILKENRIFWELMGKTWNAEPTEEGLRIYRQMPILFSGDGPIEMQKSGNWVRLQQIRDDPTSHAYFVLENGQWWVVKATFRTKATTADERFAYLDAETYWPDHIEDYFFLPPVRLKIAPAPPPAGTSNLRASWLRLSISLTNVSEQTISATALARRLRSVQYIAGTSQSAAEPTGGEPFRDLAPGETFHAGEVEIRNPEKGPTDLVFYVGPYVSNRLHLKAAE